MPAVSLVATLAATMAGFALGALWYGPLFGKRWMSAVGLTQQDIQRNANPAMTYGTTFVLGFIASYTFGLYVGPNPGRAFAITSGTAPGSSGWRRRSRPTISSRAVLPPSLPSTAGIML